MIITVTMNPAIDKTVQISSDLVEGGLNRICNTILDAGGKGINVSKTIKVFGGDTVATGFLGKKGGEMILNCLEADKIENEFILVEGETRTNLKIAEPSGRITELNENGPEILKEQVEDLLDKLLVYANPNNLFVLAGNVPRGVDKEIYARIINLVKSRGASVFLDADGDLLRNGFEAIPTIIKPNNIELAQYFGYGHEPDEQELIRMGKQLISKGIKTVAISRGALGALFIQKEKVLCCDGLPVKVLSTVGAGDAMVAALCYAWEKGVIFEEAVRLAVAVSTGAVMTPGTKPPNMKVIEGLKKDIIIKHLT